MTKETFISKIFGIALVFAMLGGMLGGVPALVGQAEASPATIYVPDDYSTIQAAVNAASPGDTIIVRDGTYTENVDVSKDHLTIQAQNGAGTTIVQAGSPGDHVFQVTADYTNISGFTVKGAGHGGIYLHGSYSDQVEHCNISANAIQGSSRGIHLEYSSDNTLVANAVSNSGYAIYLLVSPNNVLSNNTVSDNGYGIRIHLSPDNILTNNAMADNNRNLDIFGGGYLEYVQEIDTSNTINGVPVRYLVDKEDIAIDASWDVGYLGIVNCNNIIVEDLTLTNNGQGVLLVHSSNSRIENINTIDNYHGILVFSSSSNALAGNLISNNNLGVYVVTSSNNILADNVIDSNVYGLWLQSSPSTLTNNNLSNNSRNLLIEGSKLADYLCSIDTSNMINGKPIYYLIDEEGLVIDSTQDMGYLGLVNCSNMLVKDLSFADNGQGLLLAYCSNSEIKNINASNNRFGIYLNRSSGNTLRDNILLNNSNNGIYLYRSSDNVLTNNTVSGCFPGIGLYGDSSSNTITNNVVMNNLYGIRLFVASDNMIYLNNFIDNVDSVSSCESTNTWNSQEEITYAYNGNTYTSYLGNYWSDYAGSDADGDGIGETPYSIDSDRDNYPLVQPFEDYEVLPAVYLVPQHSYAPFCWTRDVEIRVNGGGFQAGQIRLVYEPTCADVPNWIPNEDDFSIGTWDSDTSGEEWITFTALEPLAGEYVIGTLTIHCVSEEQCATALDFVEDGATGSALFDDSGGEIPTTWEDGTFERSGGCGDVAPYPDCDGIINMGDVVLLLNYVGHPGEYQLCCESCGDVAPCPASDGIIGMGDVVLLLNYVGHPGEYGLCCG